MLLGLNIQAQAATYYVDAQAGNDSWTGTAQTASTTDGPWRSLAKVKSTTLKPGDNVYLKCNQTWPETLVVNQSGSSTAPISFGAYGSACTANPKISGKVAIPTFAWQQHATNIWKVQFPFSLVSNPNATAGISGWSIASAQNDASIDTSVTNCFPGKTAPCMAIKSPTTASSISSTTFPIVKGGTYALNYSYYIEPQQIVPNGDISAGITSWYYWSSTKDMRILKDTTSCLAANSGHCLTAVTNASNGLLSSGSFTVTQGEKYNLSFNVYVPTGKSSRAIVRRALSPYTTLGLVSDLIVGNNQWQTVNLTFQATSTETISRLDLEVPLATKIQIQNVRLTAAAPLLQTNIKRASSNQALGFSNSLNIKGQWRDETYTFVATDSADDAEIEFTGPALSKLQLKDISLKRTDATINPVTQVFENNLPVTMAHHPNKGFNTSKPTSLYFASGSTSPTFVKADGRKGSTYLTTAADFNLPAGANLNTDMSIWIRSQNWSVNDYQISNKFSTINSSGVETILCQNSYTAVTNGAGNKICLSPASDYPLQVAGWGYFFTGALWMVDSPDEWFYDKTSKTLYFQASDNKAPNATVAISNLDLGADVSYRNNLNYKYINIDSIDFDGVFNGINMVRASDINLTNLTIKNTGGYGIYAEGSTRLNVDYGKFDTIGTDAIQAFNATYTTVTNSDITNSGVVIDSNNNILTLPTSTYGAIVTGNNANISNNRIKNISYNGITTGSNSQITLNAVTNICMVVSDCGGIYNGGAASNTISNNIVRYGFRNGDGVPSVLEPIANAIYLDVSSNSTLIDKNTTSDVDSGVAFHNGNRNVVSNNLMFKARSYLLLLQETSAVKDSATGAIIHSIYGNQINSNLFFQTSESGAVSLQAKLGDTVDFSTFDFNQYSNLGSPIIAVESSTSPVFKRNFNFQDWRNASSAGTPRNLDVHGSLDAPINGKAIGLMSTTTNNVINNIISNGDLSSGATTGWGKNGSSTFVVNTCNELATGTKCLVFTTPASTASPAPTYTLSSPKFSLKKGKMYKFTFDAMSDTAGQNFEVVVRQAGPTFNNLMGSQTYTFDGAMSWKRFSFEFTATDDATYLAGVSNGARVDMLNIGSGVNLKVANYEMVEVLPQVGKPVQALFTNTGRASQTYDCPTRQTNNSQCNDFYGFPDHSLVTWPVTLGPMESKAVFTQESNLPDADFDGITDTQDKCTNTPPNSYVNSKGCSL